MLNALRRRLFSRKKLSFPTRGTDLMRHRPRVLVLGVYLADRPNTVAHLVHALAQSRHCRVSQRWLAINGEPPNGEVAAVTVERITGFVPKFTLLNRQLQDRDDYDFIVICDDDIVVPQGFLDAYLCQQIEFDLALAQPARTRNSHADHKFVRQRKGLRGRQTRFVEIGPLFSVRHDFAPAIMPFDETSPMGWGYDYVWPLQAEAEGLKIGIIDAAPVDHSLRDQAAAYSGSEAGLAMQAYLGNRDFLKKKEAFTIIQSFS